jgi:hypothetical protein
VKPGKDTEFGECGTLLKYPRLDHTHEINVETDASVVPKINATAGNNGSAISYARSDHKHP